MSTGVDVDDALDPGEAYRRRVSRALWFRNAAARHRFLFAPESPMGLFIEPLGKSGTASFAAQIKALKAQGLAMTAGALLVDDDGRFVFCSASASPEMLQRLSDWAREQASALPAAANLIDAGVARVQVDIASDASINALDAGTLEVQRNTAAWDGILSATPEAVADVLAERMPGDRMWFWLSDEVPAGVVPLLLQPVAWDPNRDRLDHLIEEVEASGAGEGATGTCLFVDDGSLQFRGSGLRPALLSALASWVRAEVGSAPALARLSGCKLLRTGGGKVIGAIEDAALWQGLAVPAGPATLAETVAMLATFDVGDERWFWLTPSGNGEPFVTLADAAADPDGLRFQERIAALYRRFPGSYEDAVAGVMRRLPGGQIVWSTEDARVDAWPAAVRALVDRHARDHPALRALAGSSLVQTAAGEAVRTLAVAAA